MMRPNAAGRFWLLYALFIAWATAGWVGKAHAGYSANVLSNSGDNRVAIKGYGACYLTAGMSIAAAGNTSYVSALSFADGAGTYIAVSRWSNQFSGQIIECNAVALGTTQPSFSGGVIDPGIVSGGVSGGSGGSSADLTALQNSVIALQGQVIDLTGKVLTESEHQQVTGLIVEAESPYDYANGGLLFAAMLISTLSLYLITRGAMEFYAVVKAARRL